MAGIDTTSPHYKGKYNNIYEVNRDYPMGGAKGDYVDIMGFAHYWNPDRGNWTVNEKRDEYWDELILATTNRVGDLEEDVQELGEQLESEIDDRTEQDARHDDEINAVEVSVESLAGQLQEERKERTEQDGLLWGGIKNEAGIRTAEDENIHKMIEGIQGDIKILDKIKDAVEEWPTEEVKHTIQFGDTPSVVAVGDTIKWPKETVEWNPKIEKYNEEDTIIYDKHLESTNGDEVEWNGQTSWSASELGKNTFYLTYSYPVGEYTIESNLGSKKTVTVPPVNGGQIKKEVQVTYPWYINDTPQTKLIPIDATETTTVTLSGSPKIKIPFANSQIDVKAEVMAGQYMPVSAWKTGEETINGVTYKTYYKEDSYSTSVSHKITITIKR